MIKLSESDINEWISFRSKAGRGLRKAAKDVGRSQAAKRAWKLKRSTYMKSIKRFHKSTSGQKFHRNLGRFNSTRTVREDYEIVAPLLVVSICEHLSWLIYQNDIQLYEEVYDILDVLNYITGDPDIVEDIMSMRDADTE